MAAKGTDSKSGKLSALPNVSAASAKKLVAAKIDSVAKLAKSSTKSLQKAGLSEAIAGKAIAAAKAANKVKSVSKENHY